MTHPKFMVRFGLMLLALVVVSCGNQASSQSSGGEESRIVIAFSGDNQGEIAPCG